MKKKALSIFLCATMAAAMLAGCGNEDAETASQAAGDTSSASSSTAETAESVSAGSAEAAASESGDTDTSVSGNITFVTGNDTTGSLQAMIKAFEAKYPNVTVDLQMGSGASDDQKKSLMTSFAAGDSDPDVIEADIIWVSQFAAAGWLMDLTDDLEAVSDQYLAGPLQTCYYQDKAYAFPDYTDVGLLYYRSDIIETPPTTWDELVEMCNEYQGQDGVDYGYLFQAFQGEPVSCNMLEFIKQNGGQDLNDEGQFDMNNDNTIEALEFVESLIADGISPQDVLNNKPDDSVGIFDEGKALFMRNWTYAYARAQSDESKIAGKVGVTTLPVGPNGTDPSGTLGGWNYAINANTDAPDAAKAFVKFMSSYDMQVLETQMRSTFPTIKEVYENEEVLAELPYLPAVATAAETASPRPQVKDYPTVSTIFQEYFHKALTGEQDNQSAMDEMNEKLNEALAAM